MTIDKAKLKALAEAQAVQVWVRTRGRRPDMKGQPLMYGVEGPEGVSDYEDWGFTGKAADYIATASPATMLALLAEIERLEREADQAKADGADAFGLAQGRADTIDQLKAENEDYKSGQERYEQIIEDLKAEIEALRKALGEISGQVDGNIRCAVRDVVNCRGDVQDIYGYCDNIDEIIEAAMAKEANHDR